MNTGRIVGIFDFEPIHGYLENETPTEPATTPEPEVETTTEPITVVPAEESEPVLA